MCRVLVVDDELGPRESLRILFRQKWPEHEFEAVASGREALELLNTHRVGLVIADLHRPGENGMEFLSQALHVRPLLVFIVMTGCGLLEDARRAMQRGAFAYMTKPFSMTELSVLDEALHLAQRRDAGKAEPPRGFRVNAIFHEG